MPKKVCIITTVHQAFDIRIFHKQAKSLLNEGYEVTLVAAYDKPDNIDGVKILPFSKPKSRLHRMFVSTTKSFLLAYNEKADIYHFHDFELILVGICLKLFTLKPVIYDIHEYNPYLIHSKQWIPPLFRHLAALLVGFIEKFIAARFFDSVIVPVEFMFNVFNKYNKRCTLVKNYPKLSDFSPIQPDISNNHKVIVYAGGVSFDHGYKTILATMPEVIKKHPDATCNIIGNVVTEENTHEFQAYQSESIKKGNINLIGRVNYTSVANYLHKSFIGWVPLSDTIHNHIAIPTKLFEYMMHALPVVVSDFEPVRDIIKSANCGILVKPDDYKEHAEAICYLLDNPQEAIEMGLRGLEAFKNYYNWENESIKLLKLYSNLLL